jgi:hypothetical protein
MTRPDRRQDTNTDDDDGDTTVDCRLDTTN